MLQLCFNRIESFSRFFSRSVISYTLFFWYKERPALKARGVSHYYSHPEYNSQSDAHDIAVLELDDALIFSDYVQPACLPTREPIAKTTCEVAGWGSQVFQAH